MLEFDQNILSKYPLKEAYLYFKTIIRQITKHNSLKVHDAVTIHEKKTIEAKLNAHSLGNCILFMHCQHFASY